MRMIWISGEGGGVIVLNADQINTFAAHEGGTHITMASGRDIFTIDPFADILARCSGFVYQFADEVKGRKL